MFRLDWKEILCLYVDSLQKCLCPSLYFTVWNYGFTGDLSYLLHIAYDALSISMFVHGAQCTQMFTM